MHSERLAALTVQYRYPDNRARLHAEGTSDHLNEGGAVCRVCSKIDTPPTNSMEARINRARSTEPFASFSPPGLTSTPVSLTSDASRSCIRDVLSSSCKH